MSVARLPEKARAAPRSLVVLNYTPIPARGYRVGVPQGVSGAGAAQQRRAGLRGSGVGNYGAVRAEESPSHGREFSLLLTCSLGALFLKPAE